MFHGAAQHLNVSNKQHFSDESTICHGSVFFPMFFNRRPCETLSSHESLIRLFQAPAITDTLRFTLSLQQRHEKLVKKQKRGESEQHGR